MPDPFIGEVRIFAGNYAPSGWAFCNGQILPIVSNTALFSLIGTTYGGNGTSTFALPDLRGRHPMQPGQGPGLTNRLLGETGGAESHTLTTAQIPLHTHTMAVSNQNGATSSPASGVPARDPAGIPQWGATADSNLSAAAAGPAGGDQPHNNMQPFLTLHYIIALQGIFPQHP